MMGAGDTQQGAVFTHDNMWPGKGRMHYRTPSHFREDLNLCKNETLKKRGGNASPSAGVPLLLNL